MTGLVEAAERAGYRVREQLGVGGMGVVYRAETLPAGGTVALKTLPRQSADHLLRLKREFRALTDMQHPNLVRIEELVVESGHVFVVMEFVLGDHLLDWVNQLPASERESGIRDVFRQIAGALSALHEARLVHRDVKPSNVMVTPEGRAVLLDFGLVADEDSLERSRTNNPVGTYAYMAPEQAVGEVVGPSGDWYAFATMLYEALTGQRPFRGDGLTVLIEKQTAAPPLPSSVAEDVPRDLERLCMRLLATSPHERPIGEEVMAALGGSKSSRPLTQTQGPFGEFVGRRLELGALFASLASLESGEGGETILISGGPGMGKSALLRELVGQTRQRGTVSSLVGRCYERESIPHKAFDGVVDALSSELRRRDLRLHPSALPSDAFLLGQVFPVLRRVPAIAQAPLRDVSNLTSPRERLLAAMRQLFQEVTRRRPFLIVVDDIHAADADSLAIFDELVRQPNAPRILLVLAGRPGERLDDVRKHLTGRLSEIALGPLEQGEAAEFAERALLSIAQSRVGLVPRIVEESAGEPLVLEELVRYVAFESEDTESFDFETALRRRVDELPSEACRVLVLGSLATHPIEQDVLLAASGLEPAEFKRSIANLRVGRMFDPVPGSRRRAALVPYHERLRRVVLEPLGSEDLAEAHRALAVALESERDADPEALSVHWLEAGDRDRARRYLDAAADRASSDAALQLAVRLLERRMALEEPGTPSADAVLLRLGEAQERAGHGHDAARSFSDVATRADPDVAVVLRQRAAVQLLVSGFVERGIALSTEVLREAGIFMPRTHFGRLIMFVWERLLLWFRGYHWRVVRADRIPSDKMRLLELTRDLAFGLVPMDFLIGFRLQSRSLRLAMSLGAARQIAVALSYEVIFLAIRSSSQARRAEKIRRMATELFRAHYDPEEAEPWIDSSAGALAYFLGDFEEAARHLCQAQKTFPTTVEARYFHTNHAEVFGTVSLRFLGRYAEMEEFRDGALRDAQLRGDRFVDTSLRRAGLIATLARDDIPAAKAHLSRAVWAPEEHTLHVQHWYEIEATVELTLYEGITESALERFQAQLNRVERSPLRSVEIVRIAARWLRARALLATTARGESLGARECQRRRKRARKLAKRIGRETVGFAAPPSKLILAAVAHQEGDDELAVALLEEAARLAEADNLMGHANCARLRIAELLEAGRGGEQWQRVAARLQALGVKRPERFVEVLAPGFVVASEP